MCVCGGGDGGENVSVGDGGGDDGGGGNVSGGVTGEIM